MAHYAFLDENNIVTQVIVGKNEWEDGINWEKEYGALRTSYNTYGGIYYDHKTGEPAEDQSKAFRKNYAGIGFSYDKEKDAFVPPQPFKSWVLDEDSCLWKPPIIMPESGGPWEWDEKNINWKKLEIPNNAIIDNIES